MTREEALARAPDGAHFAGGHLIARISGKHVTLGSTTADGVFHLSAEGQALLVGDALPPVVEPVELQAAAEQHAAAEQNHEHPVAEFAAAPAIEAAPAVEVPAVEAQAEAQTHSEVVVGDISPEDLARMLEG